MHILTLACISSKHLHLIVHRERKSSNRNQTFFENNKPNLRAEMTTKNELFKMIFIVALNKAQQKSDKHIL